MMKLTKSNTRIQIAYIAVFLFYLWLAAQVPYTHDDWDWGLDNGIHQLIYATLNSRYAGNFCEVVMTRSELLKTLIMGTGYFLIPFILSRFAAGELTEKTPSSRLCLFLLCNCILLPMNHNLWRQTYGWVAGYANFVISGLFLLFWIRELLYLGDLSNYQDASFPGAVLSFVITLCGQLFLENIALFCFLAAIVLCAVHYAVQKRIPVRILAMLTGAIAGLLIMFSSSLYGTLLQEGSAFSGVREIPILSGQGIGYAVREILVTTCLLGGSMYSLNVVLSLCIPLLLIWYLASEKQTQSLKWHKHCLLLNLVLIAGFVLSYLYDIIIQSHPEFMLVLDFLWAAFYFLAILFQVIYLFQGKLRQNLAVLWLSAPMIIAPLIVTTESGQRLFFTSNLFIILFALILASQIMNRISVRQRNLAKRICTVLILIPLCFYGFVYAQIGGCKQAREQIIESALQEGSTTIVLPAYPFDSYLHCPNPVSSWRVNYFKLFYGIPENVEVIFE